VKDGFLKEYLEVSQAGSKEELQSADQRHKVPVHDEINTISGGFSGGGCTASQHRKYAREVMTVEAREPNQPVEPDLYFTKVDLRDVVPHEDNPMVIMVITVGRRLHRVLVDQGSSTNVMFWATFNKLQLSPDQLRPYDGYLFGFVGDQVEVRCHVELKTTFSDGTTSRTISIRYLVVNAASAYNMLLGRPALNKLGAMASTRHMKLKLPSLEGGVIVIKSDQKAARKCYENSLKNKRGICVVVAQPQRPEGITCVKIASERQPEPAGEVQEKEIEGKKFKLDMSMGQEMQDQIVGVIARHLNAFAWSTFNMLLGRPTLNKLGTMASTRHMKMKLPSLEGGVIVIKSDQKAVRKCYENSLKNKRGICVVVAQSQGPEGITRVEIASERQPEPAGEVQEKEIEGKKFKIDMSMGQEMQDQIVGVIARHLNAFAWSTFNMLCIDPDFLCHRLTMDTKVRLMVQRRRKLNYERRLVIRE